MNFKFTLLFFLMSAATISARSILESGADIGNEEMLVSNNNRYFLRLEKSGDLVVYDKKDLKKKVWSSGTEGSESRMLFFIKKERRCGTQIRHRFIIEMTI